MMFEIELTSHVYLHMAAELAQCYFPHDTLVALARERELWLLPTRGAAAGGLLLKQRNAAGDRSVLIWEALPPNTPPGPHAATWDEAHGALVVDCRLTGDRRPFDASGQAGDRSRKNKMTR